MNDEGKRAILAEIASVLEPPRMEEDEFTIQEYVDFVKAQGGDVSYNTASSRLKRMVEEGTLTGRRVQGDRSSRVWAFRRADKGPSSKVCESLERSIVENADVWSELAEGHTEATDTVTGTWA